jgi:hypothetical protein
MARFFLIDVQHLFLEPEPSFQTNPTPKPDFHLMSQGEIQALSQLPPPQAPAHEPFLEAALAAFRFEIQFALRAHFRNSNPLNQSHLTGQGRWRFQLLSWLAFGTRLPHAPRDEN